MANSATGMPRKRDVFQLDDNDTADANTSDAVGWSRDDGLGYGMLGTANVMFAFLAFRIPAWLMDSAQAFYRAHIRE